MYQYPSGRSHRTAFSSAISACEKGPGETGWNGEKGIPVASNSPNQDSSHHQKTDSFRLGNLYKPLFATGILGGG